MPRSERLPTKNKVKGGSGSLTDGTPTTQAGSTTTTTIDPQAQAKQTIAALAANPQTAAYAQRLAAALAASAQSATTTTTVAKSSSTSNSSSTSSNTSTESATATTTAIATTTIAPTKTTTTTTVPIGSLAFTGSSSVLAAGDTVTFTLSQTNTTPVFLSCGGSDWYQNAVQGDVTNAANATVQCGTIGTTQTMTWTMPAGATPGMHSWCVVGGSAPTGDWANAAWTTMCATYTAI